MFWTLREIKDSNVRNIAGACPDPNNTNNTDFVDMVNECSSRLLRRGDWAETVVPIQVCTHRGCVVFPRYVDHVRRMNLCGQRYVPVQGLWWQFVDSINRFNWRTWWGVNGSTTGWGCGMGAQQMGRSPVFQDIMGDGRYVRVYPLVREDATNTPPVTVQIFGVDNNNQPLRTNNGDGTWSDGITITVALPYAQSTVLVRRIDRVIKSVSQGNIMLFAFNTATSTLEDIATYEPSEINPSFQKFQLNIPKCQPGGNVQLDSCPSDVPILALVKLKYIPAVADTDLVFVPPDAIKDFYQSLRFKEEGDIASANEYEKSAIRELNLALDELMSWDDAMPVTNEPFNGVWAGQTVW